MERRQTWLSRRTVWTGTHLSSLRTWKNIFKQVLLMLIFFKHYFISLVFHLLMYLFDQFI